MPRNCGRRTKGVAGAVDPDELWQVHDFPTKKWKEIDQKYDYRYPVLTQVFGILIGEGWLTRDDLAGLSEEKMTEITRIADMIRNSKKVERFQRDLIKNERIPHSKALAIFEALYREAVSVGAISHATILDGLDVDVRIARAVNSLSMPQ